MRTEINTRIEAAELQVVAEFYDTYLTVVDAMVDTAKRIKPLVLDAIEIKKQMNVELAMAREELISQHKILKGSL